MNPLWTARARDEAIELAVSNLFMAGYIDPLPEKVATCMSRIAGLPDMELAQILLRSRLLYDRYLIDCWNLN